VYLVGKRCRVLLEMGPIWVGREVHDFFSSPGGILWTSGEFRYIIAHKGQVDIPRKHNQNRKWSNAAILQQMFIQMSWSNYFLHVQRNDSRSQLPRGLRRRFAAARLLRLLRLCVRIPPEEWMIVCCECCVLSGRGLCNELITRPEESYRLWCVVVCDLETSWMRRPWPNGGLSHQKKEKGNDHANLCTTHL